MKLELYSKYTRKELHEIFSDGTNFRERAGIWGISGVVKPKGTESKYLFFCNINNTNDKVQFIGKKGLFRWKSQPEMTPEDDNFKALIDAGSSPSGIMLFAREMSGQKYFYLGDLELKSYDSNTMRPVLVNWEIKPWPLPKNLMESFVSGT